MSSLSIRTARRHESTHVTVEKQRDVVYPCYLISKGGDSVWVEQPSGRVNGWCVYLAGQDVGDHEAAKTLWLGSFAEAKHYAVELLGC